MYIDSGIGYLAGDGVEFYRAKSISSPLFQSNPKDDPFRTGSIPWNRYRCQEIASSDFLEGLRPLVIVCEKGLLPISKIGR